MTTQATSAKMLRIFRESDATPLNHEMMPFEGVDDSVMSGFAKLMEVGADPDLGQRVLCLFKQDEADGLSLCYAWFKSGFVLPKHSHSADCLYYIIAGEIRLGAVTLKKGEGFFVPAEGGYTYEVGPDGAEVLEFRNASRFNINFKGNDEAHWGRVVEAYRSGISRWPSESVPPSSR